MNNRISHCEVKLFMIFFLFQAFALPMLQTLSDDPYGIYSLILTPTRELAIQIADQVRFSSASLFTGLIIRSFNCDSL